MGGEALPPEGDQLGDFLFVLQGPLAAHHDRLEASGRVMRCRVFQQPLHELITAEGVHLWIFHHLDQDLQEPDECCPGCAGEHGGGVLCAGVCRGRRLLFGGALL